jgi:maltooligosyltrehalose trehalohydrolase
VTFLENHDQVANSLYGKRLAQLTSAARYRALVALLLLSPQTPMLFMGQEFNCSSPFLFFTDHVAPLSADVAAGRKQFLAQFPSVATPAAMQGIIDPGDEQTFQRCKLDWNEVSEQHSWLQLYIDLLAIRRTDPVITAQAINGIDGAILTLHSFILRWFDAEHGDRLLLINLGAELPSRPHPEPLLASPLGKQWSMLWSSEHPDYGGSGAINPLSATGWHVPAESAVLFAAVPS